MSFRTCVRLAVTCEKLGNDKESRSVEQKRVGMRAGLTLYVRSELLKSVSDSVSVSKKVHTQVDSVSHTS